MVQIERCVVQIERTGTAPCLHSREGTSRKRAFQPMRQRTSTPLPGSLWTEGCERRSWLPVSWVLGCIWVAPRPPLSHSYVCKVRACVTADGAPDPGAPTALATLVVKRLIFPKTWSEMMLAERAQALRDAVNAARGSLNKQTIEEVSSALSDFKDALDAKGPSYVGADTDDAERNFFIEFMNKREYRLGGHQPLGDVERLVDKMRLCAEELSRSEMAVSTAGGLADLQQAIERVRGQLQALQSQYTGLGGKLADAVADIKGEAKTADAAASGLMQAEELAEQALEHTNWSNASVIAMLNDLKFMCLQVRVIHEDDQLPRAYRDLVTWISGASSPSCPRPAQTSEGTLMVPCATHPSHPRRTHMQAGTALAAT